MLSYEDVAGAAEWLVRVFGFREELRYEEPDGRVTHVELRLGDGEVMLGNPSPRYESPKTHRERCDATARWSETPFIVDGVDAYVDDANPPFQRSRAAGPPVRPRLQAKP